MNVLDWPKNPGFAEYLWSSHTFFRWTAKFPTFQPSLLEIQSDSEEIKDNWTSTHFNQFNHRFRPRKHNILYLLFTMYLVGYYRIHSYANRDL